MDPYPKSHPLVRGGFSPLASGNWTPRNGFISGLGDVQCDQDGNCYNTSTGAYNPAPVGLVDLGLGPIVGALQSIPFGAWAMIGVGIFGIVLSSKGGKG